MSDPVTPDTDLAERLRRLEAAEKIRQTDQANKFRLPDPLISADNLQRANAQAAAASARHQAAQARAERQRQAREKLAPEFAKVEALLLSIGREFEAEDQRHADELQRLGDLRQRAVQTAAELQARVDEACADPVDSKAWERELKEASAALRREQMFGVSTNAVIDRFLRAQARVSASKRSRRRKADS
jgi:hypothetical protein